MLADAPPQNWEEARRRLAVVRRYLSGGPRSAAAADACAEEIGIGRSLFYRLARIYAAGVVDTERPRGRQPSDVADDDTALAIARAGPSASPAQIYRTVVEMRCGQGRPPPSMRAVRASCARLLAGRSLSARLGLDADFAIDRAVLDLDLRASVGSDPPEAAQLVCLVDLRAGVISRHLLSAGDPAPECIVTLAEGGAPCGSRIAVSASDPAIATDRLRTVIGTDGCVLLPGRWRVGTVIRATVGLRLGRLALRARPAGSDEPRPVVTSETAREIVDELVRRHRETVDRGAAG